MIPKYNFAGNFPDIKITTVNPVTFKLKRSGVDILSQEYHPKDNEVIVKLQSFFESLLSIDIPTDNSTVIAALDLLPVYSYSFNDVQKEEFHVIQGGVLGCDSVSFLKSNFLTWQPQTCYTTYHAPQLLRYVAMGECVLKIKGYFADGNHEVKNVASLTPGNVYTFNLNFGVVSGLFSKVIQYYDVWVEFADGNTFKQRYVYTERNNINDDWFVFENTLGGFDSILFNGESKELGRFEASTAVIDNFEKSYDIDFHSQWKKSTGYMVSEHHRLWALEFFKSNTRYIVANNSLVAICIDEPKIENVRGELAGYEFTYFKSKKEKYINIARCELPDSIEIISPAGELFFLAPRLNEFPNIEGEDILFPVQYPGSDKWLKFSYKQLALLLSSFFGGNSVNGELHGSTHRKGGTDELKPNDIGAALENHTHDEKYHPLNGRVDLPLAASSIQLLDQLVSGDYQPEMTGAILGRDEFGRWLLEVDKIRARMSLTIDEFVKNRVTVANNQSWFTDNGIIESVELVDGQHVITIAEDKGAASTFMLDDLLRGVILSEANGGLHYSTILLTVIEVIEPYRLRVILNEDSPSPKAEMVLFRVGNRTNPDRQSSIFIDGARPAMFYYVNVDSHLITVNNIAQATGNLKGYNFGYLTNNEPIMERFSNVIRGSNYQEGFFMQKSGNGLAYPVLADRGIWAQGKYFHYDRVSHNGSIWDCAVKETTKEPSRTNTDWTETVRKGIDGQSAYRLALSNDSDVVACDFSGNLISGVALPSTSAELYLGQSKIASGVTFTAAAIGATVTQTGGDFTLATLTSDRAEITIKASYSGSEVAKSIWTIAKVRGGADGSSPVIYELLPSVNVVHEDKNGNKTPATVSCCVALTVGNQREIIGIDSKLKYPGRNLVLKSSAISGTTNDLGYYYFPSSVYVPKTLKVGETYIWSAEIQSADGYLTLLPTHQIVRSSIPFTVLTTDVEQIVGYSGVGLPYSITNFRIYESVTDYGWSAAPEELTIKRNNQAYTPGVAIAPVGDTTWSLHGPVVTELIDKEITTLVMDGADGEDVDPAILAAIKEEQDKQNQRLNDWASDQYISPAEKNALKDQYRAAIEEKKSIDADVTKYALTASGAYIAYVSAASLAFSAWDKYSAAITENILIATDYTNIATFYQKRADIQVVIAEAAAKKMVDDIEVGDVNLCNNSYPSTPFEGSSAKDRIFSDASHGNYIKKDHTYTITAELMVDNDFPQVATNGIWFLISGLQRLYPLFRPTQWTVVQLTFKATMDGFLSAYNLPKVSSGRSYIKWVKLVEGTKSSVTWSPSVEDVIADYKKVADDIATTKANLVEQVANTNINATKQALQSSINALDRAKANSDDVYTKANADSVITESESRAINAANTYASAAAELARMTASVYADDIVTAEETRAIADATMKAEAARIAAEAAAKEMVNDIEVGGVNLLKQPYLFTDNGLYPYLFEIPVAPNTTYTYRGYGGLKVHMVQFIGGREQLFIDKLTGLFTTGATETKVNLFFDKNAIPSVPNSELRVKMVEGNMIGDWSPALEDVERSIYEASKSIVPNRGDHNSTTVYYNNRLRTDIVKYAGQYYMFKGSDSTSGAWSSNNWELISSYEHFATGLLLAEKANLAGFSYVDMKMQATNDGTPNLILDGINGEIIALKGRIGNVYINAQQDLVVRDAAGLDRVKLTGDNIKVNINGGNGSAVGLPYSCSLEDSGLSGVGNQLSVGSDGADIVVSGRLSATATITDINRGGTYTTTTLWLCRGDVKITVIAQVSERVGLWVPGETPVLTKTKELYFNQSGRYTEGVYNLKLAVNVSKTTDGSTGGGTASVLDFKWDNTPDIKRTEIGCNGYSTVWNRHNYETTTWDGTALTKVFKGKTDMPGCLISGGIKYSGMKLGSWGRKFEAERTSVGQYKITHTLGHVDYGVTANVISSSSWVGIVIILEKAETYVRLGIKGLNNEFDDCDFDFQISGRN